MYTVKRDNHKKASLRKNIPFYISLAVCIAAIAGAAWTTYGSIGEYQRAVQGNTDTSVNTTENSKPETQSSAPQTEDPGEKSAAPAAAAPIPESSSEEKSDNASADVPARAVAAQPEELKSCRPADGEITKPYSPELPVRSETMKDYRTHSGIDIKAEEGTAVKAAKKGKVKRIWSDPVLGMVICIEHDDGYEAYYCGLSEAPTVSEGDIVAAGNTIGFIGKCPSEAADGAHLHLEVRRSGKTADPEKWLRNS